MIAIDRKPIFDAAKARGATFKTTADVAVLDAGINAALATIPESAGVPVDEARLASVLRGFMGQISQPQWDAILAVLHNEPMVKPSPEGVTQVGLTLADFQGAASRLACTVAQIRAVDEVESGSGWFQDVRSDILDLDGPGGFIDGPNLPKILFEAHIFDRQTGGKFRAVAPNLSSAKWNKALYVGGAGEWTRLYKAMQLDRHAALMSASVGRYQIMGFNHELAGYATVEAFWDAMKTTEKAHLEAFVTFIVNSKLGAKLRAISDTPKDCEPFAGAYNGTGQIEAYGAKIAKAHKKWRLALA